MLKDLQAALSHHLLGKDDIIQLALTCLLANGHLLIEDIPGMGKTTLSHALAHLTGLHYRRIQFTSDLLPSDVLGVSIFDPQERQFHFHQGPVFAQVILADEINRATPKTQSALLEAMEEKQVTTEQGSIPLPRPFFVIATQNPSHQTGTYPLPESQLDRFLMRISIGYPPKEAERQLLLNQTINQDLMDNAPILTPGQLLDLQQSCCKLIVGDIVIDYVQAILDASRTQEWFHHGLSPRAGMAIIRAAQGFAKVNDRDYVNLDDIQTILPSVINHRLVIKKSENEFTPAELIINHVEVPV